MAEPTHEQLKVYAAHPWRCLFCGSEDIEGYPAHIQGNQASYEVRCNDCPGVWWDVFERTSVAVGRTVYTLPKGGE